MKHIHVTCAIIERDGLVFAAQRNKTMAQPLKWEFPGGKIEDGESREECLRREILEEFGVEIHLKESLSPSTHNYPTFLVTLYPYICSVHGEPELTEHAAVKWLPIGALSGLDWADADIAVLENYCQLKKS